MSNENWTATDCGKYIRVCAPNGGICEMWGDSDDAHQRFAYFVLRQMIRDLAAVTEDRDAYRVSSDLECMKPLYAHPLALREPTEDECRRIANEFLILGGPDELAGRVMFNAVREVMKK